LEALGSLDADRQLRSKEVHCRADLTLHQSPNLGIGEKPDSLGEFGRDQQRGGKPLRRIAGASLPTLFLHEFFDRHCSSHSRYTPERENLAGNWGGVTKEFWKAACVGERAEAVVIR